MSAIPPRRVYTRQEMMRLVSPKSLAIVGATTNASSFATATFNNLKEFAGNIHFVNAKYDRIGDQVCYPSIAALPEVPDCVVITIGRDSVQAMVEECAAAGVGSVVIYASGYAETGIAERTALQNRLTEIARESGLKIVGPNCIGVINHAARMALTFSPSYELSPPGEAAVALVSQSGGMGNGLNQALHMGTPLSHMLTAGNSCDVDVADYVSYLAEDPTCKAIACLFEGVEAPDRLIQAGEIAWAANKPLIMYKIGNSEQGAAAAMSHSGFLAGSAAAYRAAFERVGAVMADNVQTFIETARFFAKAPPPKSRGVAVITTSGGFGVLSADMSERYGVDMPQPEGRTLEVLKATIPDFGAARNPCDATAQVISNPKMLHDCVEALLADESYGALIYPHPYAYPGAQDRIFAMRDIGKAHGKPVVVPWLTNWLDGPDVRRIEADPDIVLFRSIDSAYSALAAWNRREERRQAWLKSGPRKVVRSSPASAAATAAKLIDAAKNKTLTEREAKEVLAAYGVPVVGEKLVQSADEAAAAAKALGFPVALKVESPDLPHKTEAGVIRLGMKTEAEVKAAYEAVMANAHKVSPPPRLNGVLVQPMISAGTEIMVGARIDPLFGPLVIAGLGGILVELLKDTSIEIAPISQAEARAMLERLKGKAMLTGFRGSEPVDMDKLADIIVRLAEFTDDQKDRIAELDVNPLICSGGRITAVDALIVKRG